MSQAAHKRSEGGTVREARRPFSSFIRRLWGGSDEEEERADRSSEKEQPLAEEQPEEFWNPKQGAPRTELVRPMRPQFPVWKKDIPGLTDPYLEEDEWQDQWLRQRQRGRKPDQRDRYSEDHMRQERVHQNSLSPHMANRYADPDTDQQAQNGQISPLSIVHGGQHQSRKPHAQSVSTMEQHPERSENLDHVVDRLLRDKDFLLAEELKHKAEEINQLLVQAQRQKMKVELDVSELESRPGNKISWLDVKIFKEI